MKVQSYKERKERARAWVVGEYDKKISGALSWGEIWLLQVWAGRYAHRYGLTKEFKENGIL